MNPKTGKTARCLFPLGAFLSFVGTLLFFLTLIPLALKSAFPHGVDFAPERLFLQAAGWFVTIGWLLQRGGGRWSPPVSPDRTAGVKSTLFDFFYRLLAVVAVICVWTLMVAFIHQYRF